MTDLAAARAFLDTCGRLLERRRFAHLFGGAAPEPVLAALKAYANPDGGFAAGDPDIRSLTSQPVAVRYALDVLAELPAGSESRSLAARALDWLQTVTLADGGVPFVLATAADAPHAPWFAPAADAPSSLLMTGQLTAAAHRLELDHPWLSGAAAYCWEHVRTVKPSDAYTFKYMVDFLDATPDRARADAEIDVLAELIPDDGRIVVIEGVEGELLDPLDVAPRPDHAGARLFPPARLEQALDELAAGQLADGGWEFTWLHWNEDSANASRSMVTLQALLTLRAYGRL
jgi:hypothetical protein